MIKLQNIHKHYLSRKGKFIALDNVNLHVKHGEIFGIVGKSGAGKSTLIRCVNLLEKPSTGQVIIDGQELTSLNEKQLRLARRQMGMIFQHFNLLAGRTVYDNIALPLEIMGESKEAIKKAVKPLLELTHLAEKKHAYPAQLSGVQKQRVAIARALATQPKVLLCDEATSALDPHTTTSILALLKDINQRLGITILLITHEMHVVKQICDQVALIEQGQIIEQAPLLELFSQPQTPAAKELVRSSMRLAFPEKLQAKLHTTAMPDSHPIVRITYDQTNAAKPIIANLIQECGLIVNILQGNIEIINEHPFGELVVEFLGDQQAITEGLNYLTHKQLSSEIIGYVRQSDMDTTTSSVK